MSVGFKWLTQTRLVFQMFMQGEKYKFIPKSKNAIIGAITYLNKDYFHLCVFYIKWVTCERMTDNYNFFFHGVTTHFGFVFTAL